MKGLQALSEEIKLKKQIVASTEPLERITDEGITVLPVRTTAMGRPPARVTIARDVR
jgi:hypothetical protein